MSSLNDIHVLNAMLYPNSPFENEEECNKVESSKIFNSYLLNFVVLFEFQNH
jgi:hypothetical protein